MASLDIADFGRAAGATIFGGPISGALSLGSSFLSSGGFGGPRSGGPISLDSQGIPTNPADLTNFGLSPSASFGSFAPNLDNPMVGSGQSSLTAVADELLRTGQAGTFDQAQAMAARGIRPPQQQSQFMDVGRVVNPQEGGFSPSDPNRPIDTSAFQRGPVSINTPAGVFSGQNGDFTFAESDQAREERAARTNSLFSLADTLESRAGVLSTKPLQKASRDVFDKTITAARQKREREVGNLSAQLSRRRIHGPLAAGQKAQLEEFFGDQEQELTSQQAVIEAELALKELGIETELLTQASQARIQARTLEIQDTVGDTELASQLASQFAQMEEINLRTRLLVAAQEAESIRSNITAGETAQLDAASRASIASEARSQTRGIGIGQLIGGIFGSSRDSLAGSLIGGIFGR
jgi:hypothetical protein